MARSVSDRKQASQQEKALDLACWLASEADKCRSGLPHASREEVEQRFIACHGHPMLDDDPPRSNG